MKFYVKNRIEKILISIVIIISFTAFIFWLLYDPVNDFIVNVPGLDNRPDKSSSTNEIIKIGEKFNEFHSDNSKLSGKWPRFRGAGFDNINKEKVKLINKWGAEGPKILWRVELGEGHAAPAVYNGKVYLLDYDEKQKADALRCFSLVTGKELWRRWYNVHVKRNHGMSRTIPAVNEKYIVTIGPKCHVMCTDTHSGEYLWGIDIVKEYGTEVPFWYTGQCPLIDNDTVIIAPGGSSLIIGIECATGKVVWKTPNPDGWKMSHSSIIPISFGEKKMYIYAAVGGICGISAEGSDKGKILWKTTQFAPSVVAPSPLVLDDGKILITAGYGAGSMLFQLKKSGEQFSVEVLQKFKPKYGIASEQQTPLYYQGQIFVILPKDAGALRNQFISYDPDDCSKMIWSSGKTERFGLGPYIIADGKFFILSDDGTLTISKVSKSKFIILDKAKIIDGQDAWGPMAITDGLLLMRDSKQMVCIDIRAD